MRLFETLFSASWKLKRASMASNKPCLQKSFSRSLFGLNFWSLFWQRGARVLATQQKHGKNSKKCHPIKCLSSSISIHYFIFNLFVSFDAIVNEACLLGRNLFLNKHQTVKTKNYCVCICRMEEVLQKLCVWCTHVQASGIIERGKTHK